MPSRKFTEEIAFDIPPIEFTLSGRRTTEPHDEWEETFAILPAVPHAALSALTSLVTTDNRGRARANASAINAFFTQTLTNESADRYMALVNDNDRIVTTNMLADVINWIVEETSARPTQRQSGLSGGISPSGNGSTVDVPAGSESTT